MKRSLPQLTRMNVCLIMFIFLISELSNAQIENPVLKWKVGDKWMVQTWLMKIDYDKDWKLVIDRKGRQEMVQFEVSGISTSNYGQCYVVNVVYPRDSYGTQDGYLLYYSCTNGRLVSVKNNTLRKNGTRSSMQYNYSAAENMPTLVEDVFSAVPFHQPVFSDAGTNLVVQEENREIRQQIFFDADGKGFTTEITVKYINGEERRIEQKWEPEVPWWTELNESKNGEIIHEQEFNLEAQVNLKPAALQVSPGILTAFVTLPEGYPVSGITSATCDGAPSERMMLSDDQTEMIIKFRRKDIETALGQIGQTIDTSFIVRGTWRGASGTSVPFQGTASIKKIVGAGEKKK